MARHRRQQVHSLEATRYGTANEHNASIPRDHWLEDREKQAIVDFHDRHPLEGYRRLTFMMLDADVVAVQPFQRLPRPQGGRPARRHDAASPPRRAPGFVQPLRPHEHWHVDVSYLNIAAHFTSCAASSTATAGSSSTGRSARP